MDVKGPLQAIQDNVVVKTEGVEAFMKSPKPLSGDDQALYRQLLSEGKTAAHEGNLDESLAAFKKAYEMNPTEKILSRIKRIEEALKEVEPEENEEFVQLDNGLIIFREMVEKLYPHQIDGVKWIYDLQKKKKRGGILADDMGLGKTIQVISALSAMFDMEEIRSVLLVLPLSLIPNWQREFESWAPGIKVKLFYGSVRERDKALVYSQRKPAVCITTYGLVQTKWEQLSQDHYRKDFTWDYIILDEGHKIKNPSKTTKGLHAISSRNRLILTGTPIQNNLRELWALFDWVMQGTLLGTQKTFKMEYETPITRARQRGASAGEIHLGNFMAESLRKIVDPYILRRTKGTVSKSKPGPPQVDKNQHKIGLTQQPSFPELKKKNDFVIWTFLSSVQEEIYKDFLEQDSVKELLASKRSPLVYLTILKKICDHPRLLPRRACHQLGLEANDSLREEDFHSDVGNECAANRIDNISDETLIEESGKLQFLLQLLQRLKEEGHRTLIFSQSRKMLNIVHRILMNRQFKVMRLDGTISKLGDRELRVKKFQQDSSYEVFLLTTQVGGVGLTLTAADRVVIFDPSWNPATDAQAVDRIYRIGQDKNVVVYRLITCGTVEEKIYRRQIFKDSIIKQSTGDNKDPYRYFTNHELKELFILDDTRQSLTQQQLNELHSGQRRLDPKLDEHLAYLYSLSMYGVSDHDLMFTQDPDDVDEDASRHEDAIATKVAEAQNKVTSEAQRFTGNEEAEARWGGFVENRKSEQPTQRKENEPVYAIEGLYDKMEGLKVGDGVRRTGFDRNKESVSSEEGGNQSGGRTAENGLDHAILVEDSPVRSGEDGRMNEPIIEIEESFVLSDTEMPEPGEDTRIISGGGLEPNDSASVGSALSDFDHMDGETTGDNVDVRHESKHENASRRRSGVTPTRGGGPRRSGGNKPKSSNRGMSSTANTLHPNTANRARERRSLTPGNRSRERPRDSNGGRQRARSNSMPPAESDNLRSSAPDRADNKRRSSVTPSKRHTLQPTESKKQPNGQRRSGTSRNSLTPNFGGRSRNSGSRNSLTVPNAKPKSRRRSGVDGPQPDDLINDEEVSGITQSMAELPRPDSVASGRNSSESDVARNPDDASFGHFYISGSSESSRASTPVERSKSKKRSTHAESSASLLRSPPPNTDDDLADMAGSTGEPQEAKMRPRRRGKGESFPSTSNSRSPAPDNVHNLPRGVDDSTGDFPRGENASRKKNSIFKEPSSCRPNSRSPDDLDGAAGQMGGGNSTRQKKSIQQESSISRANSRPLGPGNAGNYRDLDGAGDFGGNSSRKKTSIPQESSTPQANRAKTNSRSLAPDLNPDNLATDSGTGENRSKNQNSLRRSTPPVATPRSPLNAGDLARNLEKLRQSLAPEKSASRKRKSVNGSAASSAATSRSATPIIDDDLPTNLDDMVDDLEASDHPDVMDLASAADAAQSTGSSGFTPAMKKSKSQSNSRNVDDAPPGGFFRADEDIPSPDNLPRFSPLNEDNADISDQKNRVKSPGMQQEPSSRLRLALSDEESDSSDLEEDSTQESQEASSSETEGEDIMTDDHGRSQESDVSADMGDFIVDDEDTMDAYASMCSRSRILEEESMTESPWNNRSIGQTQRSRRRSTALPQRRLIVDSDSEDEDDITGYRARNSDPSDDDGRAPAALRLTSESEVEDSD